MKEKINISEILKDKKNGLRLYSPIFGECAFCHVSKDTNDICVKKRNGVIEYFNSEGLYFALGEVMLFPSKEMRDWEKFSWKKCDVLVNSRGLKILFDRWANGNYTSFYAKTINLVEDGFLDTNLHTLASEKEAKSFIKCIEERFGGKLNLQTLEIQKQTEFKDGDIVAVDLDRKNIRIFKEKKNGNNICWGKYYIGFSFNNEGKRIQTFKNYTADCSSDRLATDSEKQQLFSALEKEGKAWDDKKKQIVDLKPKWTPKTFDKVITRVHNKAIWTANIFSHIDQHGKYVTIGCISGYTYCLPYNEDTAKLIGTTNNVDG